MRLRLRRPAGREARAECGDVGGGVLGLAAGELVLTAKAESPGVWGDGATVTLVISGALVIRVTGPSLVIVVTQDGTGSRTLSYGVNYKFAGGDAPTLTTTASAIDVLYYYVKSSTETYISSALDWS